MPCDLYGSVPGDRGGRMGMTEPSSRAELRKLDAEPNYPAKPDSSTITL